MVPIEYHSRKSGTGAGSDRCWPHSDDYPSARKGRLPNSKSYFHSLLTFVYKMFGMVGGLRVCQLNGLVS